MNRAEKIILLIFAVLAAIPLGAIAYIEIATAIVKEQGEVRLQELAAQDSETQASLDTLHNRIGVIDAIFQARRETENLEGWKPRSDIWRGVALDLAARMIAQLPPSETVQVYNEQYFNAAYARIHALINRMYEPAVDSMLSDTVEEPEP